MEDIHTSIRDIRSLVIEYVDEKIATLQEMQRRRDDVYNGVIAEMRRRIAETEETNVQLRQELQDVMQQRDVMAHPGHGGHGEEEDRGDTGGGGILPDTVPITQEVERIKETQDKIKWKQEDEVCKRSIILSGISLNQIMEDGPPIGQYVPRIKSALRLLDLSFLMNQVTTYKLFRSGALKITYENGYFAKMMLSALRRFVGDIKRRYRAIDNLDEQEGRPSELQFRAAQTMKFSIVSHNRFANDRRVLTKAGKYLKNERLINYFDLLIINNAMMLKTCRGHGRRRQYQYINLAEAMQIIPHPPVEE
jgi:hypothetical protein